MTELESWAELQLFYGLRMARGTYGSAFFEVARGTELGESLKRNFMGLSHERRYKLLVAVRDGKCRLSIPAP